MASLRFPTIPKSERPAVHAFFVAMAALAVALLLALYSGAAAQLGNVVVASTSATLALFVAAWVGVTLVPVLAKRTPLRWIGYRMEYRVTLAGWIYAGGILLVALAALNTGNNLLFLILASLIASILMSGILSSITLAGVELRIQPPEHIFANQLVRAAVELENQKVWFPSFSLRVESGGKKKKTGTEALLETPVFFPYLPRRQSLAQSVPLLFPKRGAYRAESFRIVTRFPFGFLQKARRVDLATEVLVYPSVEATSELLEVMPGIEGAMESLAKGRGQDLYALRDYLPNDSARHVHWKASARLGSLMVREFAMEEECNVLLVFDPHSPAASVFASPQEKLGFERAVQMCAAIAWSFQERSGLLEYRSVNSEVPGAPATENIFAILRHLAAVQPLQPANDPKLLTDLAAHSDAFKIVVTSQARGSVPASLWHSSYIIFADDLS